MKKIIISMIVIMSILASIFSIRFILNQTIISNYNKEMYSEKYFNILYFMNITEPYVVYYNNGNELYRLKMYDEAILRYDEALEHKPSKNRVCDIRINKSLSMIANIKNNLSKNELLAALKEAREELYNNDCAHEDDDNGESKKAEKLEEEIRQLEEATQNGGDDGDPSSGGDPDDGNGGDDDGQVDPDEITTIEEMINQANSGAQSGRDDDLSQHNNYDGTFYDGKTW